MKMQIFTALTRQLAFYLKGEAGFVKERITRRNVYTTEGYYDTIIYGLTRQEQQELVHNKSEKKYQSTMIDFSNKKGE